MGERIVTVGNFGTTTFGKDHTDESLIAHELSELGYEVTMMPHEDIEKLSVGDVDGGTKVVWVSKNNILQPGHLNHLREVFGCPVVLWMSDHIDPAGANQQQWPYFRSQFAAADLTLVRQKKLLPDDPDIKYAYDCLDTAPDLYKPMFDIKATFRNAQRKYPYPVDIGFVGNWIHEPSFRNAFLKELILEMGLDVHVTALTIDEFVDRVGLPDRLLHHPMFGEDLSKLVGLTKINLSIENFLTPGFWSNRIARYMRSGGFVIATYVEGMKERFGESGDRLVYCYDADDCEKKIDYYLKHEDERKEIAHRGYLFAEQNLTMREGVKRMFSTIWANI